MQYFMIGITLKWVLMTSLSRNMHFIFIILTQGIYVISSLLVFMNIIAAFTRNDVAITYYII